MKEPLYRIKADHLSPQSPEHITHVLNNYLEKYGIEIEAVE